MSESKGLNTLRDECFAVFKEKGWLDDRRVGEDLMLMVSELAEALEDHRSGNKTNVTWYENYGKPCGIPSEMADVIIRVLNFCAMHGIDIEKAVWEKMTFNASRPFRHGGKKL